MKYTHVLIGSVAAMVLFTGCASNGGNNAQSEQNASAPVPQHVHNGDLQEATTSVEQLPTFLMKVDPQIKAVYQIAGKHLDLLQWIPCYCGCGEEAGHKSNANCFVKEVKADGTVVWDDHGTRCDTCMEIAVTASKMQEEGKSVQEIRTYIDSVHKEGYAKPTPTPMPSAT